MPFLNPQGIMLTKNLNATLTQRFFSGHCTMGKIERKKNVEFKISTPIFSYSIRLLLLYLTETIFLKVKIICPKVRLASLL